MKTKNELKKAVWLQLGRSRNLQATAMILCLLTANSQAQSYRVLHSFTGSDGSMPAANLVLGDKILYGTTEYGGVSNKGTIFKINTDGSGFATLKSFIGSDGALPRADLILSGTTLYGTTYNGGIKNAYWPEGNGTVFKINSDGSGFELLKQFNHDDGAVPLGGLILSGTNLYGTTEGGGGTNGHGTVFKISADGSGFEVLKVFTNSDGFNPSSGLVLSDTTLYGTTEMGGSGGEGTLFKVNTDGSSFEVLRNFQFDDGARPYGRLMLSGTTLYGTTSSDGIRFGTVFKVNTDGSDFAVLKYFDYDDGAWPNAGLALSGGTLYGTTSFGDSTGPGDETFPFPGCGTVFRINTDGTDFTVLHYFSNDGSGALPDASLVISSGVLYGTTFRDGLTTNAYTPSSIPYGDGKIFSVTITPPLVTAPPVSQTAEAGTSVYFSVDAGDEPYLKYQWFFNETNAITAITTNTDLELTNVQFTQAGAYGVVVTNLFGATTSSPALLNVIAPVERRPVPAINVTGEAGSLLNVDYATSLNPPIDWLAFDSVSLTSTPQFYFDLTSPLVSQRFYRAWQTGTSSVVPSLDLHMVPAITLAGNIGDTLRLDFINAIGPTDAWVTLDTVTLTNTSQLYFDTSSIGQPRRLYRTVPGP